MAGGQIDGRSLGIQDQHGETRFRYSFALTTHQSASDPVAAMRFSLEHQNPLVTGVVAGTAPAYPAASYSFLTLNDPGVPLWSLKPAEEGINRGVIARCWNLKAAPATPLLTTKAPIGRAGKTSHLETDGDELQPINGRLNLIFSPQQLNTYRLLYPAQ